MTTLHDTLRDAVAFIGGVLAEPDPDMTTAVDGIFTDLERADPMHLVTVFAGVTLSLIGELAAQTPHTQEEFWQARAARLSARLNELENTP